MQFGWLLEITGKFKPLKVKLCPLAAGPFSECSTEIIGESYVKGTATVPTSCCTVMSGVTANGVMANDEKDTVDVMQTRIVELVQLVVMHSSFHSFQLKAAVVSMRPKLRPVVEICALPLSGELLAAIIDTTGLS